MYLLNHTRFLNDLFHLMVLDKSSSDFSSYSKTWYSSRFGQSVYLKELSDQREMTKVAHQCKFLGPQDTVYASSACAYFIIDTSLNS